MNNKEFFELLDQLVSELGLENRIEAAFELLRFHYSVSSEVKKMAEDFLSENLEPHVREDERLFEE